MVSHPSQLIFYLLVHLNTAWECAIVLHVCTETDVPRDTWHCCVEILDLQAFFCATRYVSTYKCIFYVNKIKNCIISVRLRELADACLAFLRSRYAVSYAVHCAIMRAPFVASLKQFKYLLIKTGLAHRVDARGGLTAYHPS